MSYTVIDRMCWEYRLCWIPVSCCMNVLKVWCECFHNVAKKLMKKTIFTEAATCTCTVAFVTSHLTDFHKDVVIGSINQYSKENWQKRVKLSQKAVMWQQWIDWHIFNEAVSSWKNCSIGKSLVCYFTLRMVYSHANNYFNMLPCNFV